MSSAGTGKSLFNRLCHQKICFVMHVTGFLQLICVIAFCGCEREKNGEYVLLLSSVELWNISPSPNSSSGMMGLGVQAKPGLLIV